jgi:hypothetical protein
MYGSITIIYQLDGMLGSENILLKTLFRALDCYRVDPIAACSGFMSRSDATQYGSVDPLRSTKGA